MRKPNFMIVGAQKSGTTFLYRHLRDHPDVFFSKEKEPHFFNKGGVDKKSFDSYLRTHFEAASQQKWVGEASALYLHSFAAPGRIEKHIGNEIKIIICLRKPIDKAISLYLHDYRKGRLRGNEPLSYVAPDGTQPCIERSRYASYAAEYQSRFGRDNVKFLIFDDLVNNPEGFLNSAYDFLEIERNYTGPFEKVNVGFDLVRAGDYLTISDDATIPEGSVRPFLSIEEINNINAKLSSDIEITERVIERKLPQWYEDYQ